MNPPPSPAPSGGDVILYQTEDGRTRLQVRLGLAAPTTRFNSSQAIGIAPTASRIRCKRQRRVSIPAQAIGLGTVTIKHPKP